MIPLAQFIDNTADGGFAADYSLKISAWNRTAARLFGFTPAEVLGRPCYEVIGGRDDGGNVFCQAECEVLCRVRQNDFPPNYNIRTHTKGGRELWVNVSVVVIPPSLGSRGHLVHFFRPIGRQKRLEAFVRQTLSAGAELLASSHPPAQPLLRHPPLSARELEILRLLGRGASTREIARTLGISGATVRTHTQNILAKLGVHSRLEAVLYAVQQHASPRSYSTELGGDPRDP
jgi:PAS domain S-box-containing protein